MRRFIAIGLVWLGCAIAWVVLGSTLVVRSGEVSSALTSEVHQLWGGPMAQQPPSAQLVTESPKRETVVAPLAAGTPAAPVRAEPAVETPQPAVAVTPAPDLGPEASKVAVRLDLEQRKKGLLWFPTYAVDFSADYAFKNPADEARILRMRFPLQSDNALYDGFEITGKDGRPIATAIRDGIAEWSDKFEPGERKTYAIKYHSRGTQSWSYALTAGTSQVKDFELELKTDFSQVDFAPSSVSPTSHTVSADGWSGVWKFKTLLTSAPIGLDLPQELNPGPLAARITFFAPAALLFFFFVVAILAAAREKAIHPMNYFFFGCAFFAFHLLFSYLVDHLPVGPSFAVASAVSIALVISYARLFVGWRFALREIGAAQLIYLVLFSFTFFWTGFTGLTVTIGAVVTLFLMMQLTGRKQWSREEPAPAAPRGCATPYRCAREDGPAPALQPSGPVPASPINAPADVG
jgi:hypothetical protein